MLSAPASSSASGRPQQPPSGSRSSSPDLPASYVTSYASPLRNSRVSAARRAFTTLARVSVAWPDGRTPDAMGLNPHFVFGSPDGAHLIADWGSIYDYRDGNGRYLGSHEKVAGFDLTATNDAYYIYGNEAFWSGAASSTVKPGSGYSQEGSMLAFRFDANRRVMAMQAKLRLPHGGGEVAVDVFADRFAKPDRSYAELVFLGTFPGHGVAAIGPDWRIVIAMRDRTLRVLSDTSDPKELVPIELVHTQLPYAPATLSLAPPLILTTSDNGTGTTVHALTTSGVEKWSAVVPFSVNRPPVDGAGGRVVVVGGGIAAIEDGPSSGRRRRPSRFSARPSMTARSRSAWGPRFESWTERGRSFRRFALPKEKR